MFCMYASRVRVFVSFDAMHCSEKAIPKYPDEFLLVVIYIWNTETKNAKYQIIHKNKPNVIYV